jgi:signal transduction histidine kinase
MTNIHRHSGNKTADIRIVREPERVLIEARDYGRGIPLKFKTKTQVLVLEECASLRQFSGEMIISSTIDGTTIIGNDSHFGRSPSKARRNRALARFNKIGIVTLLQAWARPSLGQPPQCDKPQL